MYQGMQPTMQIFLDCKCVFGQYMTPRLCILKAEQLYGDLKVRAGDGAAAGQQKATDLGNQAYESASSAASKAASSAGDAASDAKVCRPVLPQIL